MRKHFTKIGNELLSEQANSAMFAKGNPEADFKRGVIVREDKALTYLEWRKVFKKLGIKPITSVALRGQIQKQEKAAKGTSCQFVLEEVQVSQPNETYNCQQDTMEIPGEEEQYRVDGEFIILPSKGKTTDLNGSLCMGLFSEPELSRHAAAAEEVQEVQEDKVKLDWKDYLKSILPDDESKDIRQSLESMAGQSIFNNFIFHLVSKYEEDSKTYPFKPHIQMVIKEDKSGFARIECIFFAFAENIIGEDLQFRVRDKNDQHKIMTMSEFEKYQKKENLDNKMRKLSDPLEIEKILTEIHAEKDHHQELMQVLLPDTGDSDEDEQEEHERRDFSRCTIC